MTFDRSEPSEENQFHAAHARLIISSYWQITKCALLQTKSDAANIGRNLYYAPFVVLAHDTAIDPLFFYANRAAQNLFKLSWIQFVAMPSRVSAEPMVQDERQRLLERVHKHGFIDDYSGVRIASDGTRFRINSASVWNLYNEQAELCGQAAAFSDWYQL